MSWEIEVRELERRRHLALQQGGKEGIAKQHAKGRLTIRERIDALLDKGSFHEHGRATGRLVLGDARRRLHELSRLDQLGVALGDPSFDLLDGQARIITVERNVESSTIDLIEENGRFLILPDRRAGQLSGEASVLLEKSGRLIERDVK